MSLFYSAILVTRSYRVLTCDKTRHIILALPANFKSWFMPPNKEVKKVTTNTLQKMKSTGEKISMITAYDFSFAKIFDAAGVDVVLVGDSASNVMAGHETTLPITLDQMIYHASSVIRGIDRCLVVVDLPFGSYQSNSDIALASAVRIMKETGAHAVKLEGGEEVLESVGRIISAGVPVMGHLGLTPQSIYKFGTYAVRAQTEPEANKLKKDAKLLEKAGCFAIVLEKIPANLAKEVSESVRIPTIGIGAGVYCSGQVLVIHDVIGLSDFKGRMAKQYIDSKEIMKKALIEFKDEVQTEKFPTEKNSF